MSEGLKRHNHYAPGMYLRRFASCDGKLFSYRLLVPDARYPEWTSHSSSALAAHENLYVRLGDDGETDELERWLDKEFESPAQEEIERAVHQQKITKEGWKRLIRFALLQDIRTPARLAEYMPKWNKFIPEMMERIARNASSERAGIKIVGGPQMAPLTEQFEQDLNVKLLSSQANSVFPMRVSTYQNQEESGGYIRTEVSNGRWLWHYSIRHVMTNTSRLMLDDKWTVLTAPEGVRWFTSDDPLVRVQVGKDGSYQFGGGYRSPGTIIFLPLDPRHLLFTIVEERLPLRNSAVSFDFATRIQRWIFEHAYRSLFSDRREPNFLGRTVNRQLYEDERAQWLRWHEDQLKAESDMITLSPL